MTKVKPLEKILEVVVVEWVDEDEASSLYKDEFEDLETRLSESLDNWYFDTKKLLKGEPHDLGRLKEEFKVHIGSVMESGRYVKEGNLLCRFIFLHSQKEIIVSLATSLRELADTIHLISECKKEVGV